MATMQVLPKDELMAVEEAGAVWGSGLVLALADIRCTMCHGYGRYGIKPRVCDCVYRSVFRACHNRWRECLALTHRLTAATRVEILTGGYRVYANKTAEYIADFEIVARNLFREPALMNHNQYTNLYEVFRSNVILGAQYKEASRMLGISPGNYFHAVYVMQQKLGRKLVETKPYALYPLDEYFSMPRCRTTDMSIQRSI